MSRQIAIQGYKGSFHDEVCTEYYGSQIETLAADSFDILSGMLENGVVDGAIMAIENSIAGTLLQNYRILREAGFWIVGEKYLRIKHNLCVLPGVRLEDIREVHSHPMALNQCLKYLNCFPNWKRVETKDTALSALKLQKENRRNIASISSAQAAKIYNLEILSEGIETNKMNYTRFFILEKEKSVVPSDADKASIYIKIPDEKGQLLKVLEVIHAHDLNMSKLQSFPVLGRIREYFFHLDIEFSDLQEYEKLKEDLLKVTQEYTELGLYRRDYITNALSK